MRKQLLAGALVLLAVPAMAQEYDWIKHCQYALKTAVLLGQTEVLDKAAHSKQVCTEIYVNRDISPRVRADFDKLTATIKQVDAKRKELNSNGQFLNFHLPTPDDDDL